MPVLEGQKFAGYDIMARIGVGGMGAVYKARQPVLIRLVALKVVAPHLAEEPGYIARLHHEAAAAAKFNHPNIVQIYTAGESEGKHFIVMEYVEGESLQARLQREGPLEPAEAVRICLDVARALRYGWERARMIHRDVKPDNIFLAETGEVKLGDLGLAKSTAENASTLTQRGETLGTPYYLSPEQAQSEPLDCRADIYSLGCTLFHMLAGYPPYGDIEGKSPMSVILKHLNEPAPEILSVASHCPETLAGLLRRMLAKDPEGRPADYQELTTELQCLSHELSPTSIAMAPTMVIPRPGLASGDAPGVLGASRSPSYLPVVALLAALIASVVLWALWRTQSSAGNRVAGRTAPAMARHNLVVNGGFERAKADGSPADWEPGENARGAVTAEIGRSFLRFSDGNPSETYFLQNVVWPPGPKKASISVLMRCADLKLNGIGDFGLLVAQRGANGELLARDLCCMSHASRDWKQIMSTIDVRPETKTVVAKLRILNCSGAVDFTDVRIEPQ